MSTINGHYPRSFQKLFSFFTVVEKLFVFSVKRKLRCTLQLLQSLYVSFDTSESHVEYTNDEFLREFRLLSALCPLGIQLSQSNEERAHIPGLSYTGLQMSLNDIELSFPLFSGASPSQSTKRIKMLHAAFNEYLSDRYTKDADSKVRNHYTFTKVKKDGWPPSFDSESIPLPTLPALQIEFHSLAPSSSQSGPATTSEQNPDDNINLQDSAAALEEYQDDSDGEMRTDACHAPSPLQDCSTGSSEPVSLSSIGGAHTVLERLKGLEGFYRDQIVHTETMPGRVATFEDLRTHTINEDLLRVVRERIGVKKFYTHQAKAINYILEGKHVVVSTATSSGKSVIYNLPIMSKILEDNRVTALYLFPTKALAQDQLRVLQAIICNNDSNTGELVLPVWAMACDGDTGFCDRRDARQSANIILTNPDMLHCTFLPNHKEWSRVFKHLKYVVIDESHQYRGAFGSHVACVLRRLLRVCAYYGSQPHFICCSATIANPAVHFSKLLPLCAIGGPDSLAVVDSSSDGSPQGERVFVIWNPPLKFGPSSSIPPAATMDPAPSSLPSPSPFPLPPTLPPSCATGEATKAVKEAASNVGSVKQDKERVEPIIKREPQTFAPPIRTSTQQPDRSVANTVQDPVDAVDDEASFSRFLDGCEDRPQSLGGVGSECVGYHRGWKRKKRNLVKLEGNVKATPPVPVRRSLDAIEGKKKILVMPSSSGGRLSSITEMSKLLATIVRLRVRTLAFCGVRKLVELVLKYSLQDLNSSSSSAHLAERVASYRGGYTKEERRVIEAELFSGRLIGVTATCALELGVDIGDLDVTLHLGFPRSFSSLWQQAGRAGRSGRSALSILICHDSPVDQFFVRNPSILLRSPPESATLNPDNMHVLRGHLLCAAKEIPLNSDILNSVNNQGTSSSSRYDYDLWGPRYLDTAASLMETQDIIVAAGSTVIDGTLHSEDGSMSLPLFASLPVWRMHPLHRLGSSPARDVSLRLIDPITISVVDMSVQGGGMVIDSLGYSRAFYELFEGAIYMHRAKQFLVHQLDLSSKRALSRPVKVGYYTTCRNRTDVNVLKVLESSGLCKTGTVHVVASVYGYAKIWLGTGEVFEEGECSLPNLEFETTAMWIDLPLSTKQALDAEGIDVMASIHAVNHLFESVSCLCTECDENDVATEHEIFPSSNMVPHRLLIYDKHAGGLGVCDELYTKRLQLLHKSRELLSTCPCTIASQRGSTSDFSDTIGCPSCLLDQRCSSYNRCLAKNGALKLLDLLIEIEESAEKEVDLECDGTGSGFMGTSIPFGQMDTDIVTVSPYLVRVIGTPNKDKEGRRDDTHSHTPTSTTVTSAPPQKAQKAIIDDTPRKLRRSKALRNARFNQTGVKKSAMTVQKGWTELNHQFISDRDL